VGRLRSFGASSACHRQRPACGDLVWEEAFLQDRSSGTSFEIPFERHCGSFGFHCDEGDDFERCVRLSRLNASLIVFCYPSGHVVGVSHIDEISRKATENVDEPRGEVRDHGRARKMVKLHEGGEQRTRGACPTKSRPLLAGRSRAERVGFEPTIPLPVYYLSRVASSTTPAPLQAFQD
jgi:hypothetical protein